MKYKNRIFIIAEAGINHNGSLETAYRLVDAAVEAGADAVKFQSFNTRELVAKFAPKAAYQIDSGDTAAETQYQMLCKVELSAGAHKKIISYCREKGIMFLSSPFDTRSIDLLFELGLSVLKIPSGEITNLPYLQKIGSLKKKLILSTGMSDLGEVEDALGVLTAAGTVREDIILLHCNTQYPTPFEDVNLRAMVTLREAFKLPVGYSDHTPGIEIPIAAAALGAVAIEKHFTLGRGMKGPDHKASLEPMELKQMVRAVRNIEIALGNGIKQASTSEVPNIVVARKSIIAVRDIRAGESFSEENVSVKRPGNGLSPFRWDEVIGKKAVRNFKKDELIEL